MRFTAAFILVISLQACDQSKPDHRPPAPQKQQETRAAPAFLPSRNGFSFANNFPGAPLPTFLSAASSNDAKSAFGLCGGMTSAAADYFLAAAAPPPESALPERGSTLYEYLFLRQAQSFGPGLATALRFAEWTGKSDAELTSLSQPEIEKLARALRERPVVPIGLIIARPGGPPGARNISDNHQVLAYAIEKDDYVSTVRIYDPNFPKDDAVVLVLGSTSHNQPLGFRNRPSRRSTPIRAIFVLPYEPATPPIVKSSPPPQ